MNIPKMRRYKAWLMTVLKKGALSRQEIDLIFRGQLLLPARNRDTGLMQECAAALTMDNSAASQAQRRVWNMIAQDVDRLKQETSQRKAVRRHTGMVIVMVLILALAAAGLAAALSPQVFSFLWGQETPNAFVQKDAADQVKMNLGNIHKEHVAVTILEAAFDGQELRVVYSIRDKNAKRPYTQEDEALLGIAAEKDSLGIICDWVVIDGADVYLSDCGTKSGAQNGELLFYLQALTAEQGVHPEGDFTVGLPLFRNTTGERPASVVPPELQFTLNASDALKLVRNAKPTEATIDGVMYSMIEAAFTPVAGSIRLDVTGDGTRDAKGLVYAFGQDARLYTLAGVPIGEPPVSSFVEAGGQDEPPTAILMRIVPPDVWPEEMLLAIPNKDGKPDLERQIAIELLGK